MVGMREYKCPSEQAVRLFLSGKRFFPIRPRPARVAAFQHQFQLRATRQNNANSRTPPRPIQTSQQARQGVCFSAPAHLTYVHCFRPKPTAPSAPEPLSTWMDVLKTSASASATALNKHPSSPSAKKNEPPRIQDGIPRGRPRRRALKHRGRRRRVEQPRWSWMEGTSQPQGTERSRQ